MSETSSPFDLSGARCRGDRRQSGHRPGDRARDGAGGRGGRGAVAQRGKEPGGAGGDRGARRARVRSEARCGGPAEPGAGIRGGRASAGSGRHPREQRWPGIAERRGAEGDRGELGRDSGDTPERDLPALEARRGVDDTARGRQDHQHGEHVRHLRRRARCRPTRPRRAASCSSRSRWRSSSRRTTSRSTRWPRDGSRRI